MFLKRNTDWSLLAKDLAGETNEKEQRTIGEWLNHKPENRALYKQLKSDWKTMNTMNTQFNVDNAWEKLHNRIIASGEPVINNEVPLKRIHPFRLYLTPLRIAASVMLLALVGTSVIFVTNRMQRIVITASPDERGKNITLPDGSSVSLNGNSTIRYQKDFNRNSRDIKLEGEAFFEVSPDKNKPFRIFAGEACIKVLGTSFNVDAKGSGRQVEVYVSTGVVELAEADNTDNKVLLQPGTIGLLSDNIVSAGKADNENCIAWKTGIMTFRETRLSEVTSILNEIYRVSIVIHEPGVDTTRINGSYHGDPLDEILRVICKQNHLVIEKSDNMIYLSRQ